jgi:hypothetical protein
MKEMKDYIRSKKLNRAEVRLGMRKPEMIQALKKVGHWDSKHDKNQSPKSKVSREDFEKARSNLKKMTS